MSSAERAQEDWPAECVANAGLALPAVIARRAAANPDATFLVEIAGQSMTYQQTWQAIRRRMTALTRLGVRAGDAVASFLPQSAEAQLLWLANALLGALHVPVNPQLRGEFLRHVPARSRARRGRSSGPSRSLACSRLACLPGSSCSRRARVQAGGRTP